MEFIKLTNKKSGDSWQTSGEDIKDKYIFGKGSVLKIRSILCAPEQLEFQINKQDKKVIVKALAAGSVIVDPKEFLEDEDEAKAGSKGTIELEVGKEVEVETGFHIRFIPSAVFELEFAWASDDASSSTKTRKRKAANELILDGDDDLKALEEEQELPAVGKKRGRAASKVESDSSSSSSSSSSSAINEPAAKKSKLQEDTDTPAAPLPTDDTYLYWDMIKAGKPLKSFPNWKEHEGLVYYVGPQPEPNAVIYGFDMDDNLITPKSGKKFPVNAGDWKWLYPGIPEALRDIHNSGKGKVVIWTNQLGVEKGKTNLSDICKKIETLIAELEIPIQAFIATRENFFRKPSTGSWEYMLKFCNGGLVVDKARSIYVGDAAGRPASGARKKDHSCSDRKFASNAGIRFETPEEFFLKQAPVPFSWGDFDPKVYYQRNFSTDAYDPNSIVPVVSGTEIVLCVGLPGSGKSNFSREVFVKGRGYEYVNQDTIGDKNKCLKATRLFASQNKSCVIDNTNGNPDVRAEYIRIAKEHSIPIRCLWFTTPIEIAKHLNLNRSAVTDREKVPDIAYNVYRSKFKAPSKAEGFASVQEIPFRLHFASEIERQLFLQYS